MTDPTPQGAAPRVPVSFATILLGLLLRVGGVAMLLAIVAAVMPYSWMESVHRWVGLGEMPGDPIVEYLARSLSVMYAILGGTLLVASRSVMRMRPLVMYLGWANIALGIAVIVVSGVAGMPLLWVLGEGPIGVLYGILILVLCRVGVPRLG